MIRIGEIPYANCTPLFHSLRKTGAGKNLTFVQGEPATLNRMLFAGEIDLAPSSSFEYGLHPDRYLLMPDLSISSGREIQSVLLLSTVPIEKLGGKTLELSPASATSNALLRILLHKQYRIDCHYHLTEGKAHAAADVAARLDIGNSALKAHLQKKEEGFVYDLAVLWRDFTGLPFVFALWMIRREIVATKKEEIMRLAGTLREARKYAEGHYPEIARAAKSAVGIDADDLVRYWQTLSYNLDDKKIESLERYLDYACELGLIPESPSLNFLPFLPSK
ncbi:MAG: menaquinone biosynthesis protein [Deltaproteobacteria bacterium]|nr:menaquinone biosynthesis protein [Deltaproteobacteria bacterium]